MARTPNFTLVLLMAGAIYSVDPAAAQATRTWVSGVGDDANPCSRTAPCKTFPGAISKTAAGGEINCLDPGGFGAVTITKTITIDCTGTFGSILNAGGINGVNVNDSATATPRTIKVILRGISINGSAGVSPGLNGIRFISGASLVVENVFIQNQLGGSGISIAPSLGTARVVINNTQVVNSGNATGAGLAVVPTGSGAATVSISQSVFDNNSNGILASVAGTTGVSTLDVAYSSMSNNATNGLSVIGGAGSLEVMATRINASVNATGLNETGNNSLIRVGSSTITGNNTGISGTIRSFGDNQLRGNTTNGTFTATDALN